MATLAALRHLLAADLVSPEERVVLFNTGAGQKYPEFLQLYLPVLAADVGEI